MSKDKIQPEIKRGRGRPPLSLEEKEQRRRESKKKYNEKHPEVLLESNRKFRNKVDRLNVVISKEFKPIVDEILIKTGLSVSEVFLNAVEEKYGVKLTKTK